MSVLTRVSRTAAYGLALLLAAPAGASSSGEELVERVQRRLDTLSDLRAEFVQVLHSGVLGADEPESGRLVAAKSGRMLWEYRDPAPRVAGVAEGWGWIYDPEFGELECYPLEDLTRDDVVGGLLTGQIDLRRSFEIEVDERSAEERATLYLRPRRLSEEFDELQLTVRTTDLLLESVLLVDPVGNRLEYRFAEQEVNRGVEDSDFRFALPAGAHRSASCLDMPAGSGP
jgi:outer membrane lipoprotein-sorting protein